MTLIDSTMTDMPSTFNAPRVLLVESDVKALTHHTYMLILHQFTVTYAEKASSGMSRILNGDTFDCILVDVDKFEIVMVDFLRQCLNRLPEAFVIVMGSNDIRRWICKDAEEYKVVSFLPKPCGIKEISDLLKHIFRGRMIFKEDTSNENLVQENLERNFVHRVGTVGNPLEILNTATIMNNIPVRNSQHHNDYEIKTRTTWASTLQDKSMKTLIGFDKKKAFQNTSLKQKNMPTSLRCNHFVSYLQDHKERENNMNKPSVVTWMQEGNNFQVKSYDCKRFGLSTPSDNNASVLEARYLQKQPLNSAGASFMTIENIKAKLCKAPPLSLSQQTTTPINNASGYIPQPLIDEAFTNSSFGLVEHPLAGTGQQPETQTIQASYRNGLDPLVTDGNFSQPAVEEEMTPSVVDALGESELDLGITNTYNYANGFDDASYLSIGGINVSEALAPIDRFGVLVEASVTGVGGIIEASSNDGLEELSFVDEENLFDDEDSNSETLTPGHENPSLSNSSPAEEANTEANTQPRISFILPYEGSKGTIMDEDWYMHLIHHDQNVYIKDINEVYQHQMNGSWGNSAHSMDTSNDLLRTCSMRQSLT